MPKQLVRICPTDRFCRVQNLPTSSVELIWQITELYFRQILSTDFMNRFYQDVKTGPYTYLSDLLLRMLVVGRRQQSESIEAALDME